MLILPPGHSQAATPLRRLTIREKRLLRIAKLLAAAVLVGLVVGILVGQGPTSKHGCIYATIPGPVGAQQIHQCGAQARATCGSVFRPGAYTSEAARTVAAECRRAGLATGS